MISILIFLSLVMVSPAAAESKLEPTQIMMIDRIETTYASAASRVDIHVNGNILASQVKLEDHPGFLQVHIQDFMYAQPGSFFSSTIPEIEKIAVFQPDPQSSVVRIFLSSTGLGLSKRTRLAVEDKKIALYIDQNMDQNLIAEHPKDLIPMSDRAIIDDHIVTKEKTESIELSSFQWASIGPRLTSSFSQSTWIYMLQIAGVVSLLIFMILISVLTFKRFVRNLEWQDHEVGEEIKVLASSKIDRHLKINLIEIGSFRYLIANHGSKSTLIDKIDLQKRTLVDVAPRYRETTATVAQSPKRLETSIRAKSEPVAPPHQKPALPPSKGVSYSIDDSGIRKQAPMDQKDRVQKKEHKTNSEQAIEDVTRLIRQKLKSLPKIET